MAETLTTSDNSDPAELEDGNLVAIQDAPPSIPDWLVQLTRWLARGLWSTAAAMILIPVIADIVRRLAGFEFDIARWIVSGVISGSTYRTAYFTLVSLGTAAVAVHSLLVFNRARRRKMNNLIRSPDDLQSMLQIESIGATPKLEGQPPETLLRDPRSKLSEAYFSAATSLSFRRAGGPPKSLLVTSTKPGEGKSVSAFALARVFASRGGATLLIDADLRMPSQGDLWNLSSTAGTSDVLNGLADLATSVVKTDLPSLDILFAGSRPGSPVELLARSFASLIDDCLQSYNHVVIDAPPMLGLADAALLSAYVEEVVFVVEAGRTRVADATIALARLHPKVTPAGLLTKADLRSIMYGYGYGYYYGYYPDDQRPDASTR